MSVVEEEAPPEGARLADRISAELELLSRNVDVLEQLSGRTPKGIIRLSEALHLPIHKVRYSLHLLEREGVIQPSADGAVVTDAARQFWESIDRSLDEMVRRIDHLRERAAAHRPAPPPGRKGTRAKPDGAGLHRVHFRAGFDAGMLATSSRTRGPFVSRLPSCWSRIGSPPRGPAPIGVLPRPTAGCSRPGGSVRGRGRMR